MKCTIYQAPQSMLWILSYILQLLFSLLLPFTETFTKGFFWTSENLNWWPVAHNEISKFPKSNLKSTQSICFPSPLIDGRIWCNTLLESIVQHISPRKGENICKCIFVMWHFYSLRCNVLCILPYHHFDTDYEWHGCAKMPSCLWWNQVGKIVKCTDAKFITHSWHVVTQYDMFCFIHIWTSNKMLTIHYLDHRLRLCYVAESRTNSVY